MKPTSARLPELDGLRGLAALSVFLSHTVHLIPGQEYLSVQRTPLHLLWLGFPAVTIFFVLSGFVLALPYVGVQRRPLRPAAFLLKRLCRLYPAYWAALLFALLLRGWVLAHNHLAPLNPWAAALWTIPLTPDLLLRVFAMIAPGVQTNGIDPVIWTLVLEMKVSLLFPAILFVLRRTPHWAFDLLLLAVLAALGPLNPFLSVLPIFFAGACLAKYAAPLRVAFARRSGWLLSLVFLAALALYGIRDILGLPNTYPGALTISAGSVLLLLLVLCWTPLNRLAASPPVHFLGVVSFSFYLLHLPVLLAVTSLLHPVLHSVPLCAAVALPLALGLARLSYGCIERPGIRLGVWLVDHCLPSASPTAREPLKNSIVKGAAFRPYVQ